MANIDLELLKKLREETAASVSDCRRALEESSGDYKKALDWLKTRAAEKAEKKLNRETGEGFIGTYVHQNGKVAAMVELLCETDFVARTDEFQKLAKEIAMQVAAMSPENVDALFKQDYIRDASMTIEQMIKQVIGKLGENITVKGFSRLAI
ncbi:MAG: translation elongation factor Ts [Patescibacteria group bacterium]|nr:translation elongation factor Ts [Patescibacteria group bacterium]MDE2589698.1 translation elongation factor Ts [Patescibacteria group bacterium]